MIFIKKVLFLFSIFLVFFSCGKDDLACNILTGGACALVGGASNLGDPCKLGLSSCDNGNGISHIKEVNTTVYVDPKDLNTTPTIVIIKNKNIELNPGEQDHVILKIDDQDLDEVVVTSIVGKPSVATAEYFENPDRLLITAVGSGETFAKVYGRDDDDHVGESQFINIKVSGAESNNTSVLKHSVSFAKDRIRMKISDFKRLSYTIDGFQADYEVEVTLATKLVDVNVSKSAKSIDIYSNANYGTTVASFKFTDSSGAIVIKDLPIDVDNANTDPVTNPGLTAHTVRDTQACKNTSVWKQLINSYSVGERVIDGFNSITFQSLSTATKDIILHYKNVVTSIQNRPDDAMDIKVDQVPRLDGSRDSSKGFIIQASKGFFDSGFYYVKIDDKCYRGEFPRSDNAKSNDIYKSVKLVVN